MAATITSAVLLPGYLGEGALSDQTGTLGREVEDAMLEAGSMLVAVFSHRSNALAALEHVKGLAGVELGANDMVDFEVTKGSVIIYITFRTKGAKLDDLLDGLMHEGADITVFQNYSGQSRFLTPQRDGRQMFMLIQGDNLIRPDTTPQICLSPETIQTLGRPELLGRDSLNEWHILKLVEPKDSLAVRIPASVIGNEGRCSADYLCLDFWRGTVFMGTYKLPVATINQAFTFQAVSKDNR
ncbi:hypothetical protein WJX81_005960 [Elliptochloris bilobata]|uniref:Uncharacterized protein n=1 Tax=Elliptochloris bilobata TaxID=381761 RepID=A0AAW1QV92_9CHLO